MNQLLLFVFFLLSYQLSHAKIFPENDLRIPPDKINSGLNEKEFNSAIKEVETIYRPIIESYGVDLKINRWWKNETVNASTTRTLDGKNWIINFYGGLARHPEISPDAFKLVICHEIGHHLGGAPKKTRGNPPAYYWASTEGQADYFAASKCLRRIFQKDNNEKLIPPADKISPEIKRPCTQAFSKKNDYAICVRSILASEKVARMGAAIKLRKLPFIQNRDENVVEAMFESHPSSQCRLDTYFNGAICTAHYNEDMSDVSYVTGACFSEAAHSLGARPFCWFHPSLQPQP